jgi:2-aminoethylphosphonate-pyruvate transaminase
MSHEATGDDPDDAGPILLNPGPVTLSPGVRSALQGPDLCHREPEFADLQDRIRSRLLDVYDLPGTTWAAVLLGGSGTAAVEAMLTSLVPDEGRVLIVENGVYGERMTRICGIHGIAHHVLHLEWGERIDPETVTRALENGPTVTHLAMVHHETTTGRLNGLDAIGAVCRERGIRLLVDGVSSYGAEAMDFGLIEACAGTANKCLHGIPGVSFVTLTRVALDSPPRPRSLYLNLASYLKTQDGRETPFTQPVQGYYALDRALEELTAQGGREARLMRYRDLAGRVRSALKEMDIEPLLEDGASSAVLNAYKLPPGIDYDTLHDGLKQQGFVIYAGQGGLKRSIFRISTMGEVTDEDITRLIHAFRGILCTRGTSAAGSS